MGKLMAFDMLCHNTDRLPLVSDNTGNKGNLLLSTLPGLSCGLVVEGEKRGVDREREREREVERGRERERERERERKKELSSSRLVLPCERVWWRTFRVC